MVSEGSFSRVSFIRSLFAVIPMKAGSQSIVLPSLAVSNIKIPD